jgi:hypothetical protein
MPIPRGRSFDTCIDLSVEIYLDERPHVALDVVTPQIAQNLLSAVPKIKGSSFGR